MFKVMIVDDEPVIREGLRTLIDWRENGFIICGEAVNGRDGLAKVKELNPDLIIVDIKMPGIDGLQMIDELRNRKIDCKIIILTGYSEFDYAQKAIRFKVNAYILKPINKSELAYEVKKVYKALLSNISNEIIQKENRDIFKEKIIGKIILGKVKSQDIYEINKNYNINLPWNRYQVALIGIEEDVFNAADINVIKSKFDEYSKQNEELFGIFINNRIEILIRDTNDYIINNLVSFVENTLRIAIKQNVFISIGDIVNSIDEITQSYVLASKLMDNRFIYAKADSVILKDPYIQLSQEKNLDFNACDEKIAEGLYISIDTSNRQRVSELMNMKVNMIIKSQLLEKNIKINYLNMYISIVNRVIYNNEALKHILLQNESVLLQFHSKKNIYELNKFTEKMLLEITDEIFRIRPNSMIDKIIDYISRNYGDDLKLDSIAEQFGYNSAYLGKIFKTTTGEYFNTCLDKVRINKAKQLLTEGFKVYQVADMVGYRDTDYFVKKFKKYVGVLPSKYKSKIRLSLGSD